MKKYDYVIVGAGLYGASMARLLSASRKSVLVIEKRSKIGGMCADSAYDDFYIHEHGAHIFHTSYDDVWLFVNQFAKFNNFVNSPKANYYGRLFSLPFNMNTFYELFGARNELEAKQAIALDCVPNNNPQNLEEHVLAIAGKSIYKFLVKDYTEKQWGRPCTQLPESHIKRLPFRFTFDNNYFDDIYQGVPINGYSNMIRNMLSGIDVACDTDFFGTDGFPESVVIYTGSIDDFFKLDEPLPYRSLKFITITNSNISNYQSNAVINYTGHNCDFTRIIEHKHFTKTSKSLSTVISYEYPKACTKDDERYYPIINEYSKKLYDDYKAKLPKNIFVGGRLGKFKYFDMDDVIKEALFDARYLL